MKRVWNQNARSGVLPNVFRLAGMVLFDDWTGGAAEPAAWILGGDLNLGESTIHNEMKQYQPQQGGRHLVQTLHSGSLVMRHERIPNVLPDRGRLWRHL